MWFIREKKYREAINALVEELLQWDREKRRYEKLLNEYEKRWKSPDGKIVLNDLQDALRLIQAYQKSLGIIAAADPHYKEADALLEKWGMKVDENKVVGGFRSHFSKPTIVQIDHDGKAKIENPAAEALMIPHPYERRYRKEEETWGNEAYGQETAELLAVRTDEGDSLVFASKGEVANPALEAARAMTDEASK